MNDSDDFDLIFTPPYKKHFPFLFSTDLIDEREEINFQARKETSQAQNNYSLDQFMVNFM